MTATKPVNLLFIMCDDLGYGDTGFNGHPRIQTPHLDQLRCEGGCFKHFYAGGPVCSPTRGTCLTGRHYSRYGITHANVGRLPGEEITLADITREKGYLTGHFGKWHVGTLEKNFSGKPERNPEDDFAPPWERGYEVSFATEFAVPTWDPGRAYDDRDFSRSDDPWPSPYYRNGKRVDETLLGCDSNLIVEETLRFVDQAAAADKPFFATVWFHAPHAPIEAGPEYLAMYPDCSEDEAHYYGVVTAMDRAVGNLLAHLKRLDLDENTMVWFCSDNGPEGREDLSKNRRYRGSTGGLRGRKRSLFNGGVAVPALVKWPGVVAPGSTFTMPCSTLDYFPTVASLLNVPPPDNRPIDGVDLLPLLRGENSARSTPIPYRFLETKDSMFGSPTLALLDHPYKFLTNLSETGEEDMLFDLDADIREENNIIHLHRDLAKDMRNTLFEFMDSCRNSHWGHDYPTPCEPVNAFQDITGTWKT